MGSCFTKPISNKELRKSKILYPGIAKSDLDILIEEKKNYTSYFPHIQSG